MASDITEFQRREWIRSGGGVSFEERAAQPSDFTAKRGYSYAAEYAAAADEFSNYYPDWQAFADHFVMRRAVIAISGKQTCDSDTLKASEIEFYTDVGFVLLPHIKLPSTLGNIVPGGKYQCTGFNFSDKGDGYSEVSISWQQYGEWQLIRLTQDGGILPSPGPGPVPGAPKEEETKG